MVALRCTYRLQLGPHLDFVGARGLVGYLRDLGVSHLYLSPSLQARPGSTHGYDVVDSTRLSAELGGEDGFRELCAAARNAGLGVVLDVVPNHMAADETNPFWADPELHRHFFDLDPDTGDHRRFFDVDDLAGVRVEDPDVFETTHRKVLELVREGLVEGLRIDHPDGLADPAGYLERLRAEGVPHVWVEKILEPGERLRDWPVEGTTGYEFANDVTALFVDPAGEGPLTELYAELTGERRCFAEAAYEAKLEQARGTFRPEFERLRRLYDASGLEEAAASLPVYRTYVEPWSGRVEDADLEALAAVPEELRRVLLLETEAPAEFVTRFQQTTGAVMAKGVEDTAFYRYLRLVALNEVGGDPGRFSLGVEDFHRANAERASRFPRHLLATQTHDTKRGGDVRARIGALAGMAEEWREHVLRWRELNAPLRTGPAPDAAEEYLIYQTLVGAWPLEAERLEAYVEKALREAKRNTAWVDGDPAWEAGAKAFARALYGHRPFLDSFEPFATRVAAAGERAALGQLLLMLTAPGVPDLYQGDELWSLSLVDPDNRRPVDWPRRRRALAELRRWAPATRATAKLALIRTVLALRAELPGAFAGSYEPVEAGPDVCTFLRGGEVLVAVALRPGAAFEPGPGWRDALPGRSLEADPHLLVGVRA
ncbi:MAG: malto-oligosyltrehalose synthase [Gaiellaceae bacterium]